MTESYDNPEPLAPEASDLIKAGQRRSGPPPEVKERLFGRIASTLGAQISVPDGNSGPVGAGGGEIGAGNAATAAATSAGKGLGALAASLIKVGTVVPFVVGLAAGAGVSLAVRSFEPRPVAKTERTAQAAEVAVPDRSPVGTRAVEAQEPTREENLALQSPEPQRPARKRIEARQALERDTDTARQNQDPLRPSEPAEALKAERNLIEMARTALARGRPDDALAALGRHGAAFPDGMLGEEREALSVLALSASNRTAEARQGAERFRQRFPNSMFLQAVNEAVRAKR